MDKDKFYCCCEQVINQHKQYNGIGTYGEKTVHSILKNYFQPFSDGQEQKAGRYVADIINEDGIIEIQTASFDKLRSKLSEFLQVADVTVVYPIAVTKWLTKIETETGEMGKKRKSPVKGTIYDVFAELYKIKSFLNSDRLNLCLMLMNVEEYRCPPEESGLKRGRRKGYTRYDRIPVELIDELHFNCKSDWLKFIPDNIPAEFTSKQFSELAGIHISTSQICLNILTSMDIVVRVGKSGNSYIYSVNSDLIL